MVHRQDREVRKILKECIVGFVLLREKCKIVPVNPVKTLTTLISLALSSKFFNDVMLHELFIQMLNISVQRHSPNRHTKHLTTETGQFPCKPQLKHCDHVRLSYKSFEFRRRITVRL